MNHKALALSVLSMLFIVLASVPLSEGLTAGMSVRGSTTPHYPFSCDFSFSVDGYRAFFEGSCSRDDPLIFHWIWDFGDGVVLYGGSSMDHTYSETGSYNVTLEVIDYEGRTASVSRTITVGENNPLPGFDVVFFIIIVILAALFVAASSERKKEEVSK